MTGKPTYYDIRAAFWKEQFDAALPLDEYLAAADPGHAAKWTAMGEALGELGEADRARIGDHGRTLNVLVYSGVWCGDCVRQGPMIQAIAGAGSGIDLRFIERDEAPPELRDELRILGALRVPVIVFFSEDFHEVLRFGDRTLTAYRRKSARETGAACDTGLVPPGPAELSAEMAEWVDVFERALLMLRIAPPLRKRYND